MSHPSWVCGLKLDTYGSDAFDKASHPSWVCGLKHPVLVVQQDSTRHTLRGCVD